MLLPLHYSPASGIGFFLGGGFQSYVTLKLGKCENWSLALAWGHYDNAPNKVLGDEVNI